MIPCIIQHCPLYLVVPYDGTMTFERNQKIGAQNNTQRNRNIYQRHDNVGMIGQNNMRRTVSYTGHRSNAYTEEGNRARDRSNEYKMRQRVRVPN